MIKKSPSGALCPYNYKGGYFHGIHYGSYFDDMDAFLDMVSQEEQFILKSPDTRRILMDLYETNITSHKDALAKFVTHIENIDSKVVKLAFSAEKRDLKIIMKALQTSQKISMGKLFFHPDMETAKTWLVSDEF